ncbi:uncharacterized protein EI90DRAFT_3091121 [Cantharellus anzutake]|uniref:uncharacterized protein n=1 Tax=Cantharellus anzutake TaxID=1750568 RepID=UPI001906FC6D|nr:uncharacterized protein EI90DRAFT_3091121 [Cantharellus anzutake]KAF8313968.1 hypothetical protein EI90DRAFT_3091121 [Cantharellus anzutake]
MAISSILSSSQPHRDGRVKDRERERDRERDWEQVRNERERTSERFIGTPTTAEHDRIAHSFPPLFAISTSTRAFNLWEPRSLSEYSYLIYLPFENILAMLTLDVRIGKAPPPQMASRPFPPPFFCVLKFITSCNAFSLDSYHAFTLIFPNPPLFFDHAPPFLLTLVD